MVHGGMWNGWFYFVACITNSWYIVESFVYVGTCSKHQKVCITLDFVKQNQIFALMFYVFSVMCSWLGSYKAKMKILLEMRHQLHQRKFFNFWIRFSPEEVGIFFFCLSFFISSIISILVCILSMLYVDNTLEVHISCESLQFELFIHIFQVFLVKFTVYCFRLLRLCIVFQHLNCRYVYICNVPRYMELFGL